MRYLLILFFLASQFAPTTLSALDLNYVASIPFGNTYDARIVENTAYVANYDGLAIYDITDLSEIEKMSFLFVPGGCRDIEIEGTTAYIASGRAGLNIVDISSSVSPAILGSYDTPGDAFDVHVEWDRAYVADGIGGLQIIEISNPAAPFFLGQYDAPGAYPENIPDSVRAVWVEGTLAYVGTDEWFAAVKNAVSVVDVSNPLAPAFVDGITFSVPVTSGTQKLFMDQGRLYATAQKDLKIIDVSDPSNISLLGSSIQSDGSFGKNGLFVQGNSAYMASIRNGLQIFDVSTPATPGVLGSYSKYYAYSVDVSDTVAVMGCGPYGFDLINISNTSSPTKITSSKDYPSNIARVFLENDLCYVLDGYCGIRIYDVTEPVSPGLIATSLDTSSSTFASSSLWTNLTVKDSVIYATGAEFSIFQLEADSSISFLGSYEDANQTKDVEVAGSTAYLAESNRVYSLDIGNPGLPIIGGSYGTLWALDLFLDDTLLYIADQNRGLVITNVAGGAGPTFVGELTDFGTGQSSVQAVIVKNDVAFVFEKSVDRRVYLCDISDPVTPTVISYCTVDSTFEGFPTIADMQTQNSLLYISERISDVSVVDFSDLNSPQMVAQYETPSSSKGLFVSDSYIYVADYSSLLILQESNAPWCCIGDRGNANGDPEDNVNITDITYLIQYLFGVPNGPKPVCTQEANTNGDPEEKVNITDITYLITYLFGVPSGPAPPACP